MIIRLATVDDAPELARLRWNFSPDEAAASGDSFAYFRDNFMQFVEQALASGVWAIWVAESEGRLVANLWVQIVQKVPRPGRFVAHNSYGYITNVYAEPAVRNQGIGSRLLREAVEWTRQQQAQFVLLWPRNDALGFYARVGFRPIADAMELRFDTAED
jgi:GNAT superfamily N-acetyltransferase